MPIEFNKSFNVRLSNSQYEDWKNKKRGKGFDSVSHMIRYCVDSYLDNTLKESTQNGDMKGIKNRISALENKLVKIFNEILKELIKQSKVKSEPTIAEYHKTLILNLLNEKARDEIELANLLGVDEIYIISILNDLLELGLIKRNEKHKTKYEVK